MGCTIAFSRLAGGLTLCGFCSRMRSGNVYINYPTWDAGLPFGGNKQKFVTEEISIRA
jgi:acyl-CoA reductase-like NAD-dependent aldehyde dehydrogenase